MNRQAINANRAECLRQSDANIAQDEIRCAKQIQAQTGCSWTEALRAAYRITRGVGGAA